MEGFVIAQLDAESGKAAKFWDATALIEDPNNAVFYPDKPTARAEMGSLQRQFNDSDFTVLKASRTIEITE